MNQQENWQATGMKHYKDFLIRLQTLDIQVKNRKTATNGEQHDVRYYNLSHENPFLGASFTNELRQLKEYALTDLLNLPREQIIFHLNRLQDVKELFHKFWDKYYYSPVPVGTEHLQSLLFSLNLNDIFICPFLSPSDRIQTDDNFIDDLQDSVKHREEVLTDFERAISKIIGLNKEPEPASPLASVRTKAVPVFKESIPEELFNLIKHYFTPGDQPRLQALLTTSKLTGEPLVFNGAGNQLADAFKQLFDANLIVGCNKSELENWIRLNFWYRDKGVQKSFTEKYLQDMISSNTKACQSPLFDVRRSEGKLYLFALTSNNKK